MEDEEYQLNRKQVEIARTVLAALEDDVLEEAVHRGEAYVLHAWYYHCKNEWPFFTLPEAIGRANDDCSPVYISGPHGAVIDPWSAEPMFPENATEVVAEWAKR